MSTATTTQATPKADQKPTAIEVNGVFERHEPPVRTSVLLNNEGLRQISTALEAIRTCSDLLNHRESEAGEGLPTFCQQTAHGLLAAIATCAHVIESQVNATDSDGALLLKGNDAKEIDAAGFSLWHRNYLAKSGAPSTTPQPKQAENHAQQAHEAIKVAAQKRMVNTSAQPNK